MRFSVIMASRLVPYSSQCAEPEAKLRRAIQSVLDQSFRDFELIVIADSCKRTKEIVKEFKGIRFFEVKHTQLWGNAPRNAGIKNAKGEYIIYCDSDDWWGTEHLQIINSNIKDNDWVYYNDIAYDKRNAQWIERACNIHKMGACGTSNICHASRLGLHWQHPGYAHDYYFNQQLLRYHNFKRIPTPEYYVCHIPNNYDL